KSSPKKSTVSSVTNQDQNGHEEVQVDTKGERKDDEEEEMVASEVLVTGSPSQKSARACHVVQDRSADNIGGIYPQVLVISFTHCFNTDDPEVNTRHESTMTVVTTTCHNVKCLRKVFTWRSQPNMPGTQMLLAIFICFGIQNLVSRLVTCSTFFSTWDWDVYLCISSSDTRE
ncbi:unnamed protein product, partial [Porites lobata]